MMARHNSIRGLFRSLIWYRWPSRFTAAAMVMAAEPANGSHSVANFCGKYRRISAARFLLLPWYGIGCGTVLVFILPLFFYTPTLRLSGCNGAQRNCNPTSADCWAIPYFNFMECSPDLPRVGSASRVTGLQRCSAPFDRAQLCPALNVYQEVARDI